MAREQGPVRVRAAEVVAAVEVPEVVVLAVALVEGLVEALAVALAGEKVSPVDG